LCQPLAQQTCFMGLRGAIKTVNIDKSRHGNRGIERDGAIFVGWVGYETHQPKHYDMTRVPFK
jgi:hypothetical protein